LYFDSAAVPCFTPSAHICLSLPSLLFVVKIICSHELFQACISPQKRRSSSTSGKVFSSSLERLHEIGLVPVSASCGTRLVKSTRPCTFHMLVWSEVYAGSTPPMSICASPRLRVQLNSAKLSRLERFTTAGKLRSLQSACTTRRSRVPFHL
jgi:hypothetical protein